jgi:DNA-directed RNA polymerase subunit RPC12/RpoP
MISQEKRNKLSPEQLVVAEKWERERDERQALVKQMIAAGERGDVEAVDQLQTQLLDSHSSMCEHDRSIWSPCCSCHEIEMILYPELFCTECEDQFEPEELVNGKCHYCRPDWCPTEKLACNPPEGWDGEFPFVCTRCGFKISGIGG